MPDTAPTAAEIVKAIKATGFLMEQRVASCVESLGFHTWTAYPFADPEESKYARSMFAGIVNSGWKTRNYWWNSNYSANAKAMKIRSFFSRVVADNLSNS